MSEVAADRLGPRQQVVYALAVLALLLLIAGIWFALRMFLPVSTYSAASGSMEPTLHRGDVVLARGARWRCGTIRPSLGEVIVYQKVGTRYIHRVVAEPGQTVILRHGRLAIDGVQVASTQIGRRTTDLGVQGAVIRETLPNGTSYETLDQGPDGSFDDFGPRHLAPGEWFVLGDNRDNVLDSRGDGPVPARNICAVALRITSSTEAAHVGRKP